MPHPHLPSPALLDSQPSPVPAAESPLLSPPVPAVRRVVLTGFMGAGKSTVGRLLASALQWQFLDLDQLIEDQAQETLPNLFRLHGEPAFRRIESLALVRALAHRNTILALGGGAPETLTNRLLIEQTPGTRTILLSAPFSTLLDRCMLEAVARGSLHRPNLQDPTAAEARFHGRQVAYRRLAHLTLDTTSLTPEQVTLHLVEHLSR